MLPCRFENVKDKFDTSSKEEAEEKQENEIEGQNIFHI